MSEFIRFRLADGSDILVEPASAEAVHLTSRADRVADAVSSTLGDALSNVRKAADEMLHQFRDAVSGPEEIEIEFGVVLSAEAGAFIAKTGLEGHVKVRLLWKHSVGQAR